MIAARVCGRVVAARWFQRVGGNGFAKVKEVFISQGASFGQQRSRLNNGDYRRAARFAAAFAQRQS
jgi:hypothetical protein